MFIDIPGVESITFSWLPTFIFERFCDAIMLAPIPGACDRILAIAAPPGELILPIPWEPIVPCERTAFILMAAGPDGMFIAILWLIIAWSDVIPIPCDVGRFIPEGEESLGELRPLNPILGRPGMFISIPWFIPIPGDDE
jgi:hypothetical protein